jgi:hypothetical protein
MKVTRLMLPVVAMLYFASVACGHGGPAGPAAAAAPDRGTASATVNGKTITVNYGRPELKGRELNAIAPVGTVWRLGNNQATEIETTGDLDVAGTTVKAGKYSLWAKKVGDKEWHLCFHPKTGVWGAPPLTDGYVAELPLALSTGASSVELVTIGLADAGGKARITIEWGTLVLTGDMGVK